MRYSKGDVVEFKAGSSEKQTGQVQFVEENYHGNILYIDSFSGWAYKVPEKEIISKLAVKNPDTYSEGKRFAGNRSQNDLIYHSGPSVPGTSSDFKTLPTKTML